MIGRESSGTRDGFESIFGFGEDKNAYAAEVRNWYCGFKVASDPSAIGYVSLASVNDEIKGCVCRRRRSH